LLLDSQNETATVITCSAPLPVYVSPDNRARHFGIAGGPPLGWFSDLDIQQVVHPISGGGLIYLWTDGLEDLAESKGVHPLCLAFVLRQARNHGLTLPWLAQAKDDILFAEMRVGAKTGPAELLFPILLEDYPGDQDDNIDELAALWRRSLRLVIPDLSEKLEHDVLLATREAVLNAMQHGCRGEATKFMTLQISVSAGLSKIHVWVDDPGQGHQFDFNGHDEVTLKELIDEHRGLIFVKNLANTMKFERNGASLLLEFNL
jgi:anti-sigma regulatory factor (Ser/Thr protein kinase)